jgi:hypothetical protein
VQDFTFGRKATRVTPDGTHLVFVTEGSSELTGYDQGDTCRGLVSTACSEVYVYDATANNGAGRLSCASCNPTGQAATATANFIADFSGHALPYTPHLNRAVSDDGRFVFFTSAERLVPEDVNGQPDAYEYDTTTGRLHLISSGTSPAPSMFLDASADGSNVFFATRQQLVSADTDAGYDLYDARVSGGFPEPAAPAAPGEGEACQGPASTPPSFGAFAIEASQRSDNLAPPTAVKPAVKPATKAQLLAKALHACKKKPKRQRAGCRRAEKRRYR